MSATVTTKATLASTPSPTLSFVASPKAPASNVAQLRFDAQALSPQMGYLASHIAQLQIQEVLSVIETEVAIRKANELALLAEVPPNATDPTMLVKVVSAAEAATHAEVILAHLRIEHALLQLKALEAQASAHTTHHATIVRQLSAISKKAQVPPATSQPTAGNPVSKQPWELRGAIVRQYLLKPSLEEISGKMVLDEEEEDGD